VPAAILAAGALLSACATRTRGLAAGDEGYEPHALDAPAHAAADATSDASEAAPSTLTPAAGAESPGSAPADVAPTSPPAPPVAAEAPSADEAAAAVRSALRGWAAAWSDRDMAAYLRAYDPAFTGRFQTHEDWTKDRRQHIAARQSISVDLSDVRVTTSGPAAQASFVQHYVSDALKQTNRKTLAFRLDGQGHWVIVKETVSP
jgi:hypothetical protein